MLPFGASQGLVVLPRTPVPGGLSPRGRRGHGASGHRGSGTKAPQPKPRNHCPDGQRSPPQRPAPPQERGCRHEGGTVDAARGRAQGGGGGSRSSPPARECQPVRGPPFAPPRGLPHATALRRHCSPRRAAPSLCQGRIAGRRRWRGLRRSVEGRSGRERTGRGERAGGGSGGCCSRGRRGGGGRDAVPEAGEVRGCFSSPPLPWCGLACGRELSPGGLGLISVRLGSRGVTPDGGCAPVLVGPVPTWVPGESGLLLQAHW